MNKEINFNCKSNNLCFFDLLPDASNILPNILERIILTSPKPTNTFCTFLYISKQWLAVSKSLFERNSNILVSFSKQIETLAKAGSPWSDKTQVIFHNNTFFCIWMANQLKDKQIILHNETIQKLEIIKSKGQKLLSFWIKNVCIKSLSIKNECIEIIELSFVKPIILQEITFEALCLLFQRSFCMSRCTTDEEYFYSLLFEILLHVTKNTSAHNKLHLTKKIIEEIMKNYSRSTILNTPHEVLYQNAYKLAHLIESLGTDINENSPTEFQSSYLKLIEKFFQALHWNHGIKKTTFLEGYHFANLAIKFLRLLQNQLSTLPDCTFDLIWDLKRFREKYELVADIIKNIETSGKLNCQ